MNHLLYVEINNWTQEISCVNPYICKCKNHLNKINGFDTLKTDKYTGYIIDTSIFLKRIHEEEMAKFPTNVYKCIMSHMRKYKIVQIKTRMNGSSI